jgi:hypothetical protein
VAVVEAIIAVCFSATGLRTDQPKAEAEIQAEFGPDLKKHLV